MDTELITPFVDATVNVFGTMLGANVQMIGAPSASETPIDCQFTGIIGLSGKMSGDVVIRLDASVAVGATESLLGSIPDDLDDSVTDAVGELTNMIVGSAKSGLAQYDMRLALPTVITGSGHEIRFASKVKPTYVTFECDWGRFSMAVALTEVVEPSVV